MKVSERKINIHHASRKINESKYVILQTICKHFIDIYLHFKRQFRDYETKWFVQQHL